MLDLSQMDIDALWDYRDPAGTEAKFRQLASQTMDDESLAEVLTQIARTYSLRGDIVRCDEELGRAEELIGGRPCRSLVRLYLERGRRFNSDGKPVEAIQWFEKARETAVRVNETALEIDAVHMLAIADKERALEWNLLAIAKAEQSEDPKTRKWLASLYNNVGWAHFDEGRPDEALLFFEKAVPPREQMGDKANTAVARWSVARTLRELGRIDEAFAINSVLLADDPEDPYNHQEQALLLVALGRHEEARAPAQKALASLEDDPWMQENRPEVLRELRNAATG